MDRQRVKPHHNFVYLGAEILANMLIMPDIRDSYFQVKAVYGKTKKGESKYLTFPFVIRSGHPSGRAAGGP